MLRSKVCDLLKIEYPILQGGMAWIADAALASAVSEAGGLGIISAMGTDCERLRSEIRKVKTLTDKPFGVNLMLMSPGVEDMAKLVVEEGVPVVTTGAGNPSKYMEAWLAAGIKVVPVAASVAFARLMERIGASAVIAEGGEAGGHVGDTSTMALVPQVCDAVRIPVIAAGGIGDGRGLAACLMLGASGVQMGTRFLVAQECGIHENYKKKILKASDIATLVTGRRSGHPIRTLKSPLARRYAEMEFDRSVCDDQLSGLRAGGLKKAVLDGSESEGYFMAGQIAGMIREEQSARDIVRSVVSEAEELLKRCDAWLV
ncbi:MAG TPA: enoyl-[acyl-carrier-protein] reductase FabK [Clostridiales bacterium]|nr:enoyl-[acyl-carrier-protein] reductase FabK [Clostridiales bacterium]